jgi:FkbM family methyltransferase
MVDMGTAPTTLGEPIWRDTRFRVEMTAGCHDCDLIPKVENAGQIVIERGERVQIMHNGLRVVAGEYFGDWMAEVIARLRGHHEPQEELVFYEVLKQLPDKATMIELGGFWSYYSLWFLHDRAGKRRSIVVEPDPHNLEVGRRNAQLNGQSIEFIQAMVGAERTAERSFETGRGLIGIPQITVPDLLEERGIAQIDLLHCDTQGAETDVLRSCLGLFRDRRIRFCIVSTHSHHISGDPLTHQQCLGLIKDAGGQILAEHDVYESFSGDGLIAAHFGDRLVSWTSPGLTYNRYSTSLFRNPLFDLDEANRQSCMMAKSNIVRAIRNAKRWASWRVRRIFSKQSIHVDR